MTKKKRLWIFCGSDDPRRAIPPFMLAAGGLAMDMEVTLFFTLGGLRVVAQGGAEQIHLDGAPQPLPALLKTVRDGGARLIACSAFLATEGLREQDIIGGVEFGGVATFLGGAEDADLVLTF